jgi:DNA-binding NarL/FixJ family response regulator
VELVEIRIAADGHGRGIACRRAERHQAPGTGVLVLSDYLEPRYATRPLQPGTPGRGYPLKESVTDLAAFTAAIRRTAAGESVFDPAPVQRLIGRADRDDPLAATKPNRRRGTT